MSAFRRTAFAFASAALVAASDANAQISFSTAQDPDSLQTFYKVDFAIPEVPAMGLLNVDASKLLRPATARDLAAQLTNFTNENGFAIPDAFAVEGSPLLLAAGPRIRLRDYITNPTLRFFYRFRVSAAAGRIGSDTDRKGISAGLRATLYDGADLRGNEAYQAALQAVVKPIQDSLAAMREHAGGPIVCRRKADGKTVCTAAPALDFSRLTTLLAAKQKEATALNRAWTDSLWNAPVLEVAYATRAAGRDSLGNGLAVDRHAVWATGGVGVGRWGQLLVGTQLGFDRDTLAGGDYHATGTGSARFYAGGNRRKGFVEFQLTGTTGERSGLLLNAGAEARFANWAWSTVSAGFERSIDSPRARLVSRFSLKLGLPQSSKLD